VSVRPPLVIWFKSPPRAGRGGFNGAAEVWGSDVTYACMHGLPQERLSNGFDSGGYGGADVVVIPSEPAARRATIDGIIKESPAAINLFGGFGMPVRQALEAYISRTAQPRAAVFSERPGAYGAPVRRVAKRLLLPLIHRGYHARYRKSVAAYLPLGQLGVASAIRSGWDPATLFPFMYCPDPLSASGTGEGGHPDLRMLYVGRFARATKGIDTLMDAIDLLPTGSWRIDLVGGYGEYRDRTIRWANERPNATYVGPWPADEICQRMLDYDLIVVPSRFDGWNVVVNEAIQAGRAIVSTDQAVSDEMVRASGAGHVVPADDPRALASVLQDAIDDPQKVRGWQQSARLYAPRVSSASVGRYLVDVLDHVFLEAQGSRPECPWL